MDHFWKTSLLFLILLLFLFSACSGDSPEGVARTVLSGAEEQSFSTVARHLSGKLLNTFLAGWGRPAYLNRLYRLFQPAKGLQPVFLRALYTSAGRVVALHFLLRDDAGRVIGKKIWRLVQRDKNGGGWRVAAIQ